MALHALYTRFTTQPSKGKELIILLQKACKLVSEARGCRVYIINQDVSQEESIWVTELWDNPEDHAISLTLDGCKELIAQALPLLAGKPEQVVLKAISGKGMDDV